MSTQYILPVGETQFFYPNGSPLANGTVGMYVPNTFTDKITYQDLAGSTPNINPVPLDSNGQARICGTGTYRQVVKDVNGTTLYDQLVSDGGITALVASLISNIGATLIGYIASWVGSVYRTVSDKFFDEVYLTDFMTQAQRNDFRAGTNLIDMSGAVQAMINSASRSTKFITPAGYAHLATGITFPADLYLRFTGAGIDATTFEFFGTGDAFTSSNPTTNKQKTSFEEFLLVNHAGNTNALNGIRIHNGQYWSNIKNVWVDGFSSTGRTQTYNGIAYYLSGIFATNCWGAAWDRVMLRHNGVGATLVACTGTYKNLDVQANEQHGIFDEDGGSVFLGGVFQGNDTAHYSDNTSVVQNAEITLMGGESKLLGCFVEGEGTNPPWSVIVDGRSANSRSFGSGIFNCPINRTRDVAFVRGCIYLNFVEETVIEGNSINPTSGNVGSAVIPHISVSANVKNPQIGKNAWRGREWSTGRFYADVCPVFLPAQLAALPYAYTYDNAGGGLTCVLPRIQHNWYFVGPLTAPQAETNGDCNGGLLQKATWVEKLSWITCIVLHSVAGLTAGTVTIRVYNQLGGAGANVLIKTIVVAPFVGAANVALEQHPYITRVDAGRFFVTIENSAAFAPTAGSELNVQLFLQEDDSH